jgi:very-short-patch-repair endonuclease
MPLLALAALGGVASCDALREAGVFTAAIDRAVRAGGLVRVRKGWVALPSAPPDLVGAVRVGGRLSCVSVLEQHAIWCAGDRRLHVRVAPTSGHLAAPFDRSVPLDARRHRVTMHRRALAPLPAGAADDPATALLFSITCQPRLDAIVSLDSALNQRLLSMADITDLLGRLPAKYGAYRELLDPRAQSGLETKARLRLRRYRIPLRSQVAIDGVGRVDLLIGDRLVLEVDGRRWHSSPEAFDEDRRRDLELVRGGYLVIRLSYSQVMYSWEAAETVILDLVRRDEHLWSARHRRAGLDATGGYSLVRGE